MKNAYGKGRCKRLYSIRNAGAPGHQGNTINWWGNWLAKVGIVHTYFMLGKCIPSFNFFQFTINRDLDWEKVTATIKNLPCQPDDIGENNSHTCLYKYNFNLLKYQNQKIHQCGTMCYYCSAPHSPTHLFLVSVQTVVQFEPVHRGTLPRQSALRGLRWLTTCTTHNKHVLDFSTVHLLILAAI